MKVTADSNILIYALDREAGHRHHVSAELMARAPLCDFFLTAQAFGEFLKVIRAKRPELVDKAAEQAERWVAIAPMVATTPQILLAALRFARRFQLQYWDSVICMSAATQGESVLLTEDMQDGFSAEGVTILNPFNPANAGWLDALLTPSS